MLKIRILTASVLGVGLLVCLFLLPARWSVLVFAATFILAAWEWSAFGGLRGRMARVGYTAVMAVLVAFELAWSANSAHLLQLLGGPACGGWPRSCG
jgi:phosphatidate cytidylyltransferase